MAQQPALELEGFLTEVSEPPLKPSDIPKRLPMLPLRDVVVYPYMLFPIIVGRPPSVRAIASAMEHKRFIFLTAQRDPMVEEPGPEDLYDYGTVARILQVQRTPNQLLKVTVEGLFHAHMEEVVRREEFLEAQVRIIVPRIPKNDAEFHAMVRRAGELFQEYLRISGQPVEIWLAYESLNDPVRQLYYAAAHIQQNIETKQRILEKERLKEQYFELLGILTTEVEVRRLAQQIDQKVQDSILRAQRRYIIQEQIRALQKELGEDEEVVPELAALREAIDRAGMPEHVRQKAYEELERLRKTPPISPEFAVNRTYLEWLTSLPWSQRTEDNLDIEHVRRILDEDHYDLEKPKERILEYLAVARLKGSVRSQILCFVGPPGVGKSSLARSIARALGRRFVRISLGGVRDEAEIRGHRRTYIGAMPGKIIQAMKRAGTINPVSSYWDEVGQDVHGPSAGDPSSALLEVLDPEQKPRLQRPLPGGGLRPLARALHRHRQREVRHPAAAAGPHGGHRAPQLLGRREARDRQTPHHPEVAARIRHGSRSGGVHRRCTPADHSPVHARGRGAQPGAADRDYPAQGGAPACRAIQSRRARGNPA
jgi:ATP-dependent Lon protease